MRDFNKNILKVGDSVAFLEARYRDLKKGIVVDFTAKMIVIEWDNKGSKEICRREPSYVALIQNSVDNE
jgi:hypothetical protein